jgi:hypothetical protein
LTAGMVIVAFMFMLMIRYRLLLASPSTVLRSETAPDQRRMTNLHRYSLQNSR